MRFVSEALVPGKELFDDGAFARGEPPLPRTFAWKRRTLAVDAIVRTWRSTNTDRGDTYLARHWYALRLAGGREAVVYFDRKARRNAPSWWLYTIAGDDASERDENPS